MSTFVGPSSQSLDGAAATDVTHPVAPVGNDVIPSAVTGSSDVVVEQPSLEIGQPLEPAGYNPAQPVGEEDYEVEQPIGQGSFDFIQPIGSGGYDVTQSLPDYEDVSRYGTMVSTRHGN